MTTTAQTSIKEVSLLPYVDATARIEVYAEPQDLDEGDGVEARVYLCLPQLAGSLDEHLRFGDRLFLCGKRMNWNWGDKDPKTDHQYRQAGDVVVSDTYAGAIADASAQGERELAKLLDALKARAEAHARHC